jgi:molybdopterin-guanine dinucleotide biosynthesis protein A
VARRIVVVAAPGQSLPTLPMGVDVVRDSAPGTGPLAGIADGLRTLGGDAAAVLVVSCDVPLVSPALLELLRDVLLEPVADRLPASSRDPARPVAEVLQWVVPEVEGHLQVLISAVRPGVLAAIEAHLAAGRRDPRSLVERLAAAGAAWVIPEKTLRPVDPGLRSFRDLDTPRDLEDLGDFLAAEGES